MPRLRPSSLLLRLRSGLDTYPRAVAAVARYVLENPERVIHQSLRDLSGFSGAGQATIVRFCRLLGFGGFGDFKIALSADLATGGSSGGQLDEMSDLEDILCTSIRQTARNVVPQTLARIAWHLRQTTRTDVFGAGVSGIIAELMTYRLLRLGLNANTTRDATLAHEVSAGLNDRTAAIAISQSGTTTETLRFLQNARQSGAYCVAITCYPKSALARTADDVMLMARLRDASYGGPITDVPRAVLVIETLAGALGASGP